MRQTTLKALNQINKDFYSDISENFSQTRSRPWQGWSKLDQYLKTTDESQFSVLDLGCGNGRFAGFVTQVRKNLPFTYTGVDSDPNLLVDARKLYVLEDINFVENDLYEYLDKDISITHNFIGVFGVMHHIPSYSKRLEVIKKLRDKLLPNGIIALSFWKFAEFDRFTKKQVSWETVAEIDKGDLEDNDYLLNWNGSDKPRYSHYFSDEEITSIITDTNMKVLKNYRADGKNEKLNQYLVFQK